MPRLYTPQALASAQTLDLHEAAARHAQVLRLQPGDALTLLNGQGGEYEARIVQMGRRSVQVQVLAHNPIEREAVRPVHLAVCLMANERMDWLVEKATELGAASLQPLVSERCVLRLSGERAEKRVERWHATVIAASEQCGRNHLMHIHPLQNLKDWLPASAQRQGARALLSLAAGAQTAARFARAHSTGVPVTVLTGPEGGLSPAEEALALQYQWSPISLGARILRAETAALAATAILSEHQA
jgi:16S rRNA (uracil1498-N3)-methyltransferase